MTRVDDQIPVEHTLGHTYAPVDSFEAIFVNHNSMALNYDDSLIDKVTALLDVFARTVCLRLSSCWLLHCRQSTDCSAKTYCRPLVVPIVVPPCVNELLRTDQTVPMSAAEDTGDAGDAEDTEFWNDDVEYQEPPPFTEMDLATGPFYSAWDDPALRVGRQEEFEVDTHRSTWIVVCLITGSMLMTRVRITIRRTERPADAFSLTPSLIVYQQIFHVVVRDVSGSLLVPVFLLPKKGEDPSLHTRGRSCPARMYSLAKYVISRSLT